VKAIGLRGRRVPGCAAAGLPFGRAVVQPEHASIANAYGAAVAEVGGEVDFMFSLATITRSSALAWAEREAQRRAAEAGADPAALRTVPPLCGVPWSGGASRSRLDTNAIENLNGLVGHFVRHVRRWRDGRMLVRWIAAGLQEVSRGFRPAAGSP
jgi:hypothetical protein